MRISTRLLTLSITLSLSAPGTPAGTPSSEPFPVIIEIDAEEPGDELKEIWRFFGADEPNYAYMPDGRKLLAALGGLSPKNVYFRTHNLLCSGNGTPALKWGSTGAYDELEDGTPVYDWTILDRIFDAYLDNGVRPYVEIGFMPRALSIRPEPYQHSWRPGAPYQEIYTGWAFPPRDHDRWAELVHRWTKHCLERYGREEVETWYWETWNEPNIGYWQGTAEEFHELHDYAIDAVRRALPTARVGGPDVAGHGGDFARAFYEHCLRGVNYATGEIGTPLDFVSFHAKGRPTVVNGHVRMGIARQLQTIEEGLRIIASYPELKEKPIVIGESDPEGCAACQGPRLAYRKGTMYSSYTAASFKRKLDLAEAHGVNLEGALTWAFEFEGQPYFAGFRSLASNGIAKPVLNVFRMFARMGGKRLPVHSSGEVPLHTILNEGVRGMSDVTALASRDGDKVAVMVWNYHDDDVRGPDARVQMTISRLPHPGGSATVQEFRVDEEHGNAYTLWERMGSPQEPSPEQYRKLESAGRLAAVRDPEVVRIEDSKVILRVELPRQAVSLFVVEW